MISMRKKCGYYNIKVFFLQNFNNERFSSHGYILLLQRENNKLVDQNAQKSNKIFSQTFLKHLKIFILGTMVYIAVIGIVLCIKYPTIISLPECPLTVVPLSPTHSVPFPISSPLMTSSQFLLPLGIYWVPNYASFYLTWEIILCLLIALSMILFSSFHTAANSMFLSFLILRTYSEAAMAVLPVTLSFQLQGESFPGNPVECRPQCSYNLTTLGFFN